MGKKEKTKRFKTRRGKLSAIAGIVTLAVAIVIVYIFVKGGGKLDLSVIRDLRIGDSTRPADTFALNSDRSEVAAALDDGFFTAGKLGVTVLDKAGEALHRDTVPMKNAAVKAAGEYAVAYDIGGRTALVYDLNGMTARINAGGEIVDASVNADGWFTVCAQEGGGFKGKCSVYNREGETVFYFDSSTGYLLSAAITDDCKSLYVMTLTPTGSRLLFFNLNSNEEQWELSLPGEVALEIKGAQKDGLWVISDKALTAVSREGGQNKIFGFDGRHIGGYSLERGEPIALMLLSYGVGTKGQIITLRETGEVLGTMDTNRRLKDILSAGKYVYVLWADGFEIYGTELKEVLETGESANAGAIVARGAREVYIVDGGEAVRIDGGLQ